MAESSNAYRYNVSMKYMGGTQDGDILAENIRSVIIDHNYDLNCMPVMYSTVNIDRRMLDDMILHQNEAYILLNIRAYNSSASFGSATNCINCKCTYFINDDLSKLDQINYGSQTTQSENMGQAYTPTSIGLICIDHINNNKKNCAMVKNEATMQDILQEIMSGFQNLVMEPLEYNDTFEHIIIPSNVSDTINKTLQYLNNLRVFYKTPYRYYQDFNNTYLVSSSGKGYSGGGSSGSTSGSGTSMGNSFGGGGNSININITDVDDMSSVLSGIINTLLSSILGLGGTSSGTQQVSVNYSTVEVQDNTLTNKSRNKMRLVQTDTTEDQDLAVKSGLTKEAIKSMRLENDNEHMIENIIAYNNSINYLVSFVKNDLDSSIFTINKEIKINNIQRYHELNGTYLLFRKREIYLRQDDTFILMTSIGLRRIDSEGDESNQSGSGSYFSL